MDYDGSNQHQITHLGSISLSPRVSPDGSRLAFSALTKSGWEIMMYSLELNRAVSFPHLGGTNLSPAWSGDGTKTGLFVVARRRAGDLRFRCVGRESPSTDHRQGAGCFAGMESQDECADLVCQRAYGPAADLHDGSRRHEPAAHDRSRIRCVAQLGAERAVSVVFLGAQIRAG